MSRANSNEKTQADHVNVSISKQPPITVWECLLVPMYIPLCNISSNRMYTRKEVGTHANPDKYDGDTNATMERRFCRRTRLAICAMYALLHISWLL